MASTFSPNLDLELMGRGDQVGVWDTATNSNWSIVDLGIGGSVTIGLNNANVVLSAAQYKNKTIVFNSTLTGSVTITFPTNFTKSYEIFNNCTGSSAFTITLQTTVAGINVICAPPGETVDVWNDSFTLRYKNLGRIGSLWEHGGSSVPNWVSGCTVAPYLNCDGTAFSSATFPVLANFLGGATLPDLRGNTRYTLNQGTGRLTTASGGLDGNTNLSLKTTQVTIGTSNLPPYTPAGSVSVVSNSSQIIQNGNPDFYVGGGSGAVFQNTTKGTVTSSGVLTGTAQGGVSNVLPVGSAVVAGITMIRAA